MGSGMSGMGGVGMWGMGLGWALIIIVVVLATVALWKYLRCK